VDNVFWAALGAAIGGGFVALVVEWIRWFIDRPLVKVEVSLGFLHEAGEVSTLRQVFYVARNVHTKTVSLSSFGLSYKKKELGTLQVTPQMGYQFPYKLEGQSSITQWASVDNLLGTLYSAKRTPKELKWVWFTASSGKLYRSKIKKWVIQELDREFQQAYKALQNYYGPMNKQQ
jgi:hypothetical protein